ncbi:MAG: permease-like cell division protein FtsX [Cyclobacteriaceae bacterium]|nr:permease-like cell division protein FtsX [Cyclobacteriaceae bacterium]
MQKTYVQKKLGSYPYTGVIASISLALFVTGLFGMLIIYSQELERLVRENIRVQVYLKNGLTETQQLQVEKSIEALPYINKKDSIQFISKEDAAEKFIAEAGEDFTKFLGENPLHDAYLISILPTFHSPTEMEKVKTEIEKMNGVFQVYYVEGLIESINKNVRRVGLVLIGLVVILLITVVLMINNTIRLALFSQRFLIRSMQLVGAQRWFIQRPFLLRSLVYGLLAGIFSAASIWAVLNYANREIEDLSLLMNFESILFLMGTLLLLGMLIAFFSTYFSIRKYLKMSLDELY